MRGRALLITSPRTHLLVNYYLLCGLVTTWLLCASATALLIPPAMCQPSIASCHDMHTYTRLEYKPTSNNRSSLHHNIIKHRRSPSTNVQTRPFHTTFRHSSTSILSYSIRSLLSSVAMHSLSSTICGVRILPWQPERI